MQQTKIYTVTHRAFTCPEKEIYVPIQVGKMFTGNDLGYISDDIGENIADKNRNYCELTALYWIWKNEDADVVGLCHYRRYFTRNSLSNNAHFFLDKIQIEQYLSSVDAIVPEKYHWPVTVAECYANGAGRIKDLESTRSILETKYPEYLPYFDQVMNANSAFYCNMIVSRKPVLDQYCEWLFDVLGELEKITDLSDYTVQEARIYGYISELLLNVWINKNQVTYVEMPIVNTSESVFRKIKKKLKKFVYHYD